METTRGKKMSPGEHSKGGRRGAHFETEEGVQFPFYDSGTGPGIFGNHFSVDIIFCASYSPLRVGNHSSAQNILTDSGPGQESGQLPSVANIAISLP